MFEKYLFIHDNIACFLYPLPMCTLLNKINFEKVYLIKFDSFLTSFQMCIVTSTTYV